MNVTCLVCKRLEHEAYRYKMALDAADDVAKHYDDCLVCQSGKVCQDCYEMVEEADSLRRYALQEDLRKASFARLQVIEMLVCDALKLAEAVVAEVIPNDNDENIVASNIKNLARDLIDRAGDELVQYCSE